jgi:3'-5' exoribonuclease
VVDEKMNDVDAAMSYLSDRAASLIEGDTPEAGRAALHMLMVDDFKSGYGAMVGTDHAHHAYPGGLPIHTAEVVEIALNSASASNLIVNKDILTTAAIFHDVMKIRDYTVDGNSTLYKKRICHVAGSFALWVNTAYQEGVPQEFTDAVSHCILAHHGRQEWGSPVLPQTVEASILHFADMLSMAYGRLRRLPEVNVAENGARVKKK